MKEQTNYETIKKILEKNNGLITRKEIDEENIPSWFLTDFVKRNGLNKIAPGLYASDGYAADEYFVLQRRYPKYVFSGMSALYLHHLTDKIPEDIYVSCPQGYHPSRKIIPSLVIAQISNQNLYFLGIADVETMFGNKVKAYDKERTICDLIKRREKYDGETFVKALRAYLSGNPDQRKLFRYAKEMKIENKVFEIMEVITNEG